MKDVRKRGSMSESLPGSKDYNFETCEISQPKYLDIWTIITEQCVCQLFSKKWVRSFFKMYKLILQYYKCVQVNSLRSSSEEHAYLGWGNLPCLTD